MKTTFADSLHRQGRNIFLAMTGLYIIFTFTGCVAVPDGDGASVSTPVAQPDPNALAPSPVVDDLTVSAHTQRALQFMHKGDEVYARAHLQAALVKQPDSPRARMLLDQLQADPVGELGAQSFPYTVKAGDTLSALSERYLGDHLRFYLLARYNGIADPSALAVGQLLRMPGLPSVTTARPDARPPPEEPELFAVSVPSRIEPPAKDSPETDASPVISEPAVEAVEPVELPVSAPPESANSGVDLPTKSAIPGAESVSLGTDEPVNPEAERLYARAEAQESKGRLEAAYALYTRVLEQAPQHPSAAKRAAEVKKELVADYHLEATALMGSNETKQAIAIWQRVLELDPEHAAAKGSLRKAQELL